MFKNHYHKIPLIITIKCKVNLVFGRIKHKVHKIADIEMRTEEEAAIKINRKLTKAFLPCLTALSLYAFKIIASVAVVMLCYSKLVTN